MEKIGFFEQLTSEFQTGTSIQIEQGRVLARKGHLMAPLSIVAGPIWMYMVLSTGSINNTFMVLLMVWIFLSVGGYLYNAIKKGDRHVLELLDAGDAVLIQTRAYTLGFPKSRKSFSLSKDQIKLLVMKTPFSIRRNQYEKYEVSLQFESLDAILFVDKDLKNVAKKQLAVATALNLPEASVSKTIEISKKSNFSRLLNPFRSHIQG